MLDVSRAAPVLPSRLPAGWGRIRAPCRRRARLNDRADDRVIAMTIALPRAGERAIRMIDLSRPVMVLLALFLCGLVLLPLGWLVWYSVTDNDGALTARPISCGWRPIRAFATPYLTALEIAASVALGAAAAALPLAWLVARTDLPLRRLHPRAGHRLVRDPALSRRDRLGDSRRAEQRHPQPAVPRDLFGLGEYEHLFNIYTASGVVFTMACYSFPYVFVLVANALDNIPADLEDASAILGGSALARRCAGSPCRWYCRRCWPAALVAFVQTLTQFGVPAILAMPAGFHVITTKIWALFQYPPEPHLAAAAAMPLLVVTILLLRGQQLLLGRRGYTVIGGKSSAPRLVRLGAWRWPALAFAVGAAVAADPAALCGADQDRAGAHPVRPAELRRR